MVVMILVSAKDAPAAWGLRCIVREKLITFVQEGHLGALPKHRIYLSDNQSINLTNNKKVEENPAR